MIDSVPDESPIEAIIAVAQVIFGDGDINWGRIIGVFYFAYRMCVKVCVLNWAIPFEIQTPFGELPHRECRL